MKSYCVACEKNKDPILSILKTVWTEPCEVLEIGSGTGQHAMYFSEQLPHLSWQPTEQADQLSSIECFFKEQPSQNLKAPFVLDVAQHPWPLESCKAVFTANTLHIMSWPEVEELFCGLGKHLVSGGKFVCYGPFNKGGNFTSESNQNFDQWLKDRDPKSGIRDIGDLERLAKDNHLVLIEENDMPSNNKTLIWQKCEMN